MCKTAFSGDSNGIDGLIAIYEALVKKHKTRDLYDINGGVLDGNPNIDFAVLFASHFHEQFYSIKALGIKMLGWTEEKGFLEGEYNDEFHTLSLSDREPIQDGEKIIYLSPVIFDKNKKLLRKGKVKRA